MILFCGERESANVDEDMKSANCYKISPYHSSLSDLLFQHNCTELLYEASQLILTEFYESFHCIEALFVCELNLWKENHFSTTSFNVYMIWYHHDLWFVFLLHLILLYI